MNGVQVLLHTQMDANIPPHFGKFPLHLAVKRNLLPLVRLMAEHGGVDIDASWPGTRWLADRTTHSMLDF